MSNEKMIEHYPIALREDDGGLMILSASGKPLAQDCDVDWAIDLVNFLNDGQATNKKLVEALEEAQEQITLLSGLYVEAEIHERAEELGGGWIIAGEDFREYFSIAAQHANLEAKISLNDELDALMALLSDYVGQGVIWMRVPILVERGDHENEASFWPELSKAVVITGPESDPEQKIAAAIAAAKGA